MRKPSFRVGHSFSAAVATCRCFHTNTHLRNDLNLTHCTGENHLAAWQCQIGISTEHRTSWNQWMYPLQFRCWEGDASWIIMVIRCYQGKWWVHQFFPALIYMGERKHSKFRMFHSKKAMVSGHFQHVFHFKPWALESLQSKNYHVPHFIHQSNRQGWGMQIVCPLVIKHEPWQEGFQGISQFVSLIHHTMGIVTSAPLGCCFLLCTIAQSTPYDFSMNCIPKYIRVYIYIHTVYVYTYMYVHIIGRYIQPAVLRPENMKYNAFIPSTITIIPRPVPIRDHGRPCDFLRSKGAHLNIQTLGWANRFLWGMSNFWIFVHSGGGLWAHLWTCCPMLGPWGLAGASFDPSKMVDLWCWKPMVFEGFPPDSALPELVQP